MILHTTEVTYLSDYRLFLRFNNGEAGEVDLAAELEGEMFEPLKDPALFATVYQHPVMKTVAWKNGADLAPEFLLELMHQQNEPETGNRFFDTDLTGVKLISSGEGEIVWRP